MMIDSPCHGCSERTPTCHGAGNCERYDTWKAQHEMEREERRRRKQQENAFRTYKIELSTTLKKEARKK